MKPSIIPKPTSPYAALNFPAGIPVTHPIPVGMVDGNLLWDLDLDRTTAAQLLLIAQLVATARSIHVDEVIAGIKATQNFGIAHHHVAQLIGDDTSPDNLEAYGRSYRVKHILLEAGAILANISIDDAIVMFVESKYAIGSIEDADSPSAEMVDLWLPVIIREVGKHAPDLAKILSQERAVQAAESSRSGSPTMRTTQADLLLAMSEEYFNTFADIEIALPIPAYTAYLLCAILQVRLRDPNCGTTEPIRHYIRMLESAIVQLCPEASWMMERGWHPEFDGGGE